MRTPILLIELIYAKQLKLPIIAGYDIGSRIAQAVALKIPERIGGLVVTPAYAGIGDRTNSADLQPIIWYQHFHRLDVAADALDGNHSAISAYLKHFLSSWSFNSDLINGDRFEKLIDYYARPGAFRSSIAWYRANKGYQCQGQINVRTAMLWPEQDPLFSIEWADRLSEFFTDATLTTIPNCGHFVPLEAPHVFATAISNQYSN